MLVITLCPVQAVQVNLLEHKLAWAMEERGVTHRHAAECRSQQLDALAERVQQRFCTNEVDVLDSDGHDASFGVLIAASVQSRHPPKESGRH